MRERGVRETWGQSLFALGQFAWGQSLFAEPWETDGEPVKVVNRLTTEELDELVNAGAERPLGCLPMRLEEYAELLRWLAGNPSKANAEAGPAAASAEAAGDGVAILRRRSPR